MQWQIRKAENKHAFVSYPSALPHEERLLHEHIPTKEKANSVFGFCTLYRR